MINLIPPEGHRMIRKEYMLRVGSAVGLLLTAVIVILTVAMVPTYVLITAQIESVRLENTQQEDDSTTLASAEAEVRATQKILTQLKSFPETTALSMIVSEIQKSTPTSITLKAFDINKENPLEPKIQVQGIAPRREDLIRFKNTLESSPFFERAEVPIADLARDANVPFTITVTLTPKT